MSQSERKAKINSIHDLPVIHQCQLLSISRSSGYYQSKAANDEELSLMQSLDSLPYNGARRLRDVLLDEHGLLVNRKHVRRLMMLMDIRAIYPGDKGTSKPNNYPYLLRDIEIDHSNQVWCTQILRIYRWLGALPIWLLSWTGIHEKS